MKILLLFVLSFITLEICAQSYHPFPLNYAGWSYQYYDDYGRPTVFHTYYLMSGDTIIFGTNYKKISGGALRENNKIIYFFPDTASQEYVLYDFNLNLGDTLIHPFGGAICSNDTVIVQNVDSVSCSDGYHRRLFFNSFAIWIEGVGSDNYLLSPCNVLCVSGNDVLTCMLGDSGEVYSFGFPTYCMTSISNLSQLLTTLSPNPATTHLTITTSTTTLSTITLYDITSRKMMEEKFNKEATLNIDGLARGIYLYKMISEKGEMTQGRFVKE